MRVLDSQVRALVTGAGPCALVFLIHFSSTRFKVRPSHLMATTLRSNTTGEGSDVAATTTSALDILDDIQNATTPSHTPSPLASLDDIQRLG